MTEYIIKENTLDRINEIEKTCKNPNWGEMDEIAVSETTIENTKKFISLLSNDNFPPEIDPTARGWIELNWNSDKYIVAVRINDNELLLGKTSIENSSDKFYASKLFSNFDEKEVGELLTSLLFGKTEQNITGFHSKVQCRT